MKKGITGVAIYSRVSTAHAGQDCEVQLAELRPYCQARGWQVVEEIQDHGFSGGSDNRPGLKRLMELARTRKVDVIVVVKLDRLFRSVRHLLNTLEEFRSLGIDFVSLKDALDFSTPGGRLLVGVLACIGQFEKDLAKERTLAGLAHARRKGKTLGRPRRRVDEQEVLRLRAEGRSLREIAETMGVSPMTVSRAIRSYQKRAENLAPGGLTNQAVAGA